MAYRPSITSFSRLLSAKDPAVLYNNLLTLLLHLIRVATSFAKSFSWYIKQPFIVLNTQERIRSAKGPGVAFPPRTEKWLGG